jgi:NAD(P)-dependent dehydrogenase (short-subunit alcohol dehydrogenase family)
MIADVSTAVVTGGGHGIGRSLCRRLHRDGVRVVVVDIDAEAAARVAAEIDGVSICADVGDEVQVTEAIDTVEKDVGPIDLFISNAGVGFGDADDYAASAGGGMHSVADRWEACWRVNVMAHVYAARSLVPRMVARGGGYLVNVASAAGLLAQIGDAAYRVPRDHARR